MTYDNASVPVINASFDSAAIGQGRIVSTVDGELKLLQCSPSALADVMKAIDGSRTFSQVEECLQEQYPIKGIRTFLSALLQEGILRVSRTAAEVSGTSKTTKVSVIGSGRFAETIVRIGSRMGLSQIEPCSADDATNGERLDSDVAIIAPEHSTYAQFLELNRLMLERDKPFIPAYCGGQDMILGPFIIPGKTACFECQAMYHIQAINKKIDRNLHIRLEDILNLSVAMPSPESLSDEQLAYYATIVCRDVMRFFSKEENLSLFESEKHFDCGLPCERTSIVYYPTTECECCHGKNRGYEKWSEEIRSTFRDVPVTLSKNICYTTGGMRSCSDVETIDIIERALNRSGLSVSIEPLTNSRFSIVMPCFRAAASASQNNRTPYFFRTIVGRGKGLTGRQAFLSASFEMVERLSAQYFGDIPIVEATWQEVKSHAIDLIPIVDSIQNHHTDLDRFSPDLPIDWIWAKSLITGKHRLIPAFMVFINDVKFKGQFLGSGSSGLAAGVTIDDAVLQAMLEVIEHDAWMIGQANQAPLPIIDCSTSQNEKLRECVGKLKSLGFQVICRDYTNDLGFPVFRAWIVDPNNFTHYAFNGFGASISAEIALERAISEAILSDMTDASRKTIFGPPSISGLISAKETLYSLFYFQQKDIAGESSLCSLASKSEPRVSSVKEAITLVIEQLQEKMPDCDVLYVDLTREVLEIPVVRVIITDRVQRLNAPLLSISPRTFSFSRSMGYSDFIPSVKEFYLGPYPH